MIRDNEMADGFALRAYALAKTQRLLQGEGDASF